MLIPTILHVCEDRFIFTLCLIKINRKNYGTFLSLTNNIAIQYLQNETFQDRLTLVEIRIEISKMNYQLQKSKLNIHLPNCNCDVHRH